MNDESAINHNANFQSFTSAILVLVRVTTLDQWHLIMLTCADLYTPNCADEPGTNCGTRFSYVYFSTFVFMCSYIMTNLFLAFIMDNFVYLTHDWSELDARHIHRFTTTWNYYDKHGLGHIDIEDLVPLLKALLPPLGNGCLCPERIIYARILRLKVPIENDKKVKFSELLLTLVIDFLSLDASNKVLRDDVEILFPSIDMKLLDRVLPLSYDPRIFNQVEKDFYQLCASNVISGYYRIYKTNLIAKNKLKREICEKMKPTTELDAPILSWISLSRKVISTASDDLESGNLPKISKLN